MIAIAITYVRQGEKMSLESLSIGKGNYGASSDFNSG